MSLKKEFRKLASWRIVVGRMGSGMKTSVEGIGCRDGEIGGLGEVCGLSAVLSAEIARSGPMPFERFMERALYDPELGYYAGSRQRVGRAGDYVTAPSTGRVFGRLLAMQFREVWDALGQPGELFLIEQGANDGTLLRDVLLAAKQDAPALFCSLKPVVIEPYKRLRHLQERVLADVGLDVQWLASEADLPRLSSAIHYSNELLDAFPTHWLESDGTRWLEIHVSYDSAARCFRPLAQPVVSMSLMEEIARRLPLRPAGFQAELCLRVGSWAHVLASRIESGFILVMDYGWPRRELYAPTRPQGTLRIYQNHRQGTNPLFMPGNTDITAHVDFTACVEEFETCGWRLAGFCDQQHFLVAAATRLLEEWEKTGNLADVPAFKALTHPSGMGTTFHALGFCKGVPSEAFRPTGFSYTRQSDLDALRAAADVRC